MLKKLSAHKQPSWLPAKRAVKRLLCSQGVIERNRNCGPLQSNSHKSAYHTAQDQADYRHTSAVVFWKTGSISAKQLAMDGESQPVDDL